MRPQTKTGGNKDETDIKIYEEQMVASDGSHCITCYSRWHLFAAFYMLATVAYIIYMAVTQRILMAGFMVSTIFMFGIELWNFASRRQIT